MHRSPPVLLRSSTQTQRLFRSVLSTSCLESSTSVPTPTPTAATQCSGPSLPPAVSPCVIHSVAVVCVWLCVPVCACVCVWLVVCEAVAVACVCCVKLTPVSAHTVIRLPPGRWRMVTRQHVRPCGGTWRARSHPTVPMDGQLGRHIGPAGVGVGSDVAVWSPPTDRLGFRSDFRRSVRLLCCHASHMSSPIYRVSWDVLERLRWDHRRISHHGPSRCLPTRGRQLLGASSR